MKRERRKNLEAEEKALKYITSCSKTEKELRDYLRRKEYPEEEIKKVITDFVSWGYLDDRRYCHEFFRYGIGKGWGDFRIIYELSKRGVDESISSIEFEDYKYENEAPENDQLFRAIQVAEKTLLSSSWNREEEMPQKLKGRVMRKLDRYGYPSDVIIRTIETINVFKGD